MGWMVIRHIRKRIRELPMDRKNRAIAQETLVNAKSLFEVVQIAGYRLDATEAKFFKSIPPVIDGALRSSIVASIAPENRSRINFDVAYLAEGTGYTLTISSAKRTGDVDVVLQAPAPASGAPVRASGAKAPRPPAARARAGTRRASAAKRKPAARRRSR